MRGSGVIYPGPARLVLAAAGQLRDARLIERHAEEWLANLQGRTHLQQWRDSVSLLVRGARTTRWIYDGTYGFRPRKVVVGQVLMALIMMAGTGFLFFFPSPRARRQGADASAPTLSRPIIHPASSSGMSQAS